MPEREARDWDNGRHEQPQRRLMILDGVFDSCPLPLPRTLRAVSGFGFATSDSECWIGVELRERPSYHNRLYRRAKLCAIINAKLARSIPLDF